MTVVGVDISTLAVHLAWLEDGKPCRWHCELGGSKTHVIDRIRAIRIQWPRDRQYLMPGTEESEHIILNRGIHDFVQSDVTDVAIEFPYSVNRDTNAKLNAVLGAVTRQAPPWARVAWPSSGELRAAIGAKNTKEAAHAFVHAIVCTNFTNVGTCILDGWDEHELDALTACIGWTRILKAQDDT